MSAPKRIAPPPEPEAVPSGKSALVIAAAFAIFGIAVGASQWARHEWTRAVSPPPPPVHVGSQQIDLVNQQLFSLDHRAEHDRDSQRRRLTSYGWVDRSRGVIHIPLDRAVDEVLAKEGARP